VGASNKSRSGALEARHCASNCLNDFTKALRTNFVLRRAGFEDDTIRADLRAYYRAPHVRFTVRTRVLCQAGRCRAAGTRSSTAQWLLERAPLWVVVHVCALLRDTGMGDDDHEAPSVELFNALSMLFNAMMGRGLQQ
jgi:hypothetical protein